jgi:ATP-dependent Lon protease
MDDLLLPLFPLEIVLLPHEALPLHIFEERYKDMIRQCLETQGESESGDNFGVVLARNDKVERVGCTAHILNVTRKYDDGRLDIMTAGNRRFEILFTNDERTYLRGGVEFFDDDSAAAPPSPSLKERSMELFQRAAARLDKDRELPDGFPRPDLSLSFQFAGCLPLDLTLKQQLLEKRSESERLRVLNRGIERLIRQVDRMEKARNKAGGNGKLRDLGAAASE